MKKLFREIIAAIKDGIIIASTQSNGTYSGHFPSSYNSYMAEFDIQFVDRQGIIHNTIIEAETYARACKCVRDKYEPKKVLDVHFIQVCRIETMVLPIA